jgi:hypothetical protein
MPAHNVYFVTINEIVLCGEPALRLMMDGASGPLNAEG